MNNWLFFSLLAPFLWAINIVLDGVIRRHHIKSDWAITWFVGAMKIPTMIVLLIIFGFSWPSNSDGFLMILAGFLYVLPLLIYYRAVQIEESSRVSLFLQVTPIFTFAVAYFLIGERLSSSQGVAFLIILLGTLIAAYKHVEKKLHFSKAFWLIFSASFIWAVSDVLFKKIEVNFDGFFEALTVFFIGSTLLVLLLMLTRKSRKKIKTAFKSVNKKGWGIILLNELFGAGGDISFFYAITLGKASLTTVLLGTQPIFTFVIAIILGRRFITITKESVDKKSLLLKGAALILILIGLWYL